MGDGPTVVLRGHGDGSWVGFVRLVEAAVVLDGVKLGEGFVQVVAGDLVVFQVERLEQGLVE